MSDIKRIAITSKSVFTLHGADGTGRVLRRNLRRRELLQYLDWLAVRITGHEFCWRSATACH